MRPSTLLDVLLETAAVLDSEDRYTPKASTGARDVDGDVCGYTTPEAYTFTLIGACRLAVRNLGITGQRDRRIAYDASEAVEAHLTCSHRVPSVDRRTTWRETDWDRATYEMVITALDDAILGTEIPIKPAEIELEDLILTPRTYNALHRRGVRHAGHLVALTRDQLERIPNLGKKTLSEIDAALATVGLSLAGTEATR